MGSLSSLLKEWSRNKSVTPDSDGTQAPSVSDPNPACIEQTPSSPIDHGPSSSDSAVHTNENNWTNIVITNVALGLIQILTGIYTVVQPQRNVVPVQVHEQPPVERDSDSALSDEDRWNLSIQLLERYEQLGGLEDLQEAMSLLEAFLKSTPVGDQRYLRGLINFGVMLLQRFQRLGEFSDLEKAISMLTDAVELTPDGHCDKPGRLINLGNCFLFRFRCLGEPGDLRLAISKFSEAVDLTPDGDLDKPGFLNNLGTSLRTRFSLFGESSDLEEAILRLGNAVELIPDDHCDKPACLSNLGNSFFIRFKCLGEFSDLEEAMSRQLHAVDLAADGHPNKPSYLNDLGNSFLARFERLGELGDLEQAILRQRDAVNLTPDGHPDKPSRLNSLGTSLRARFGRLGGSGDLEEAILKQRDAVNLTPNCHPDKPGHLNSLGNSLLTRFNRFGESSDLEEAILRLGNAVDVVHDGHINKPVYLNSLATSFATRFRCLGELSDVKQAISMQQKAVDLTPEGYPNKPSRLGNLGNYHLARFQRTGESSDLGKAILSQQEAVDLTPSGHPEKAGHLSNLGSSLYSRFRRLGELSDLDHAISMLGSAVTLTPNEHPDKPDRLSNLSSAFVARFQRFGELSDLEQAILRLSDAVELIPDDHPAKSGFLENIGNAIRKRFEYLRDFRDLDRATSTLAHAVHLAPHGHPGLHASLDSLGNIFLLRFDQLGELSDLERAISTLQDAVDHTPHDHPNRPGYLYNLANSFLTRFRGLGGLGNLEQAAAKFRDSLALIPEGHPDRPVCLNGLGSSLLTRFERLGEHNDLEEAISNLEKAVELTPNDHPGNPRRLANLGKCYFTRFKCFMGPSDLEQMASLYWSAASSPTGSATARFQASLEWISCARASSHRSLLHAYSLAIGLLPQLAWIGLSLAHRYSELMQGADIVRNGAAAALDSGLLETAVEWLEQGRSIVWGELFQLRSSYDTLSAVHPDYARRLQELSMALEHATVAREKTLSSDSTKGVENHAATSLEQAANRQRALAIERDRLLQNIRRLPGFERFLLHKEFSQLRASAHSGPVVVLNAAESRCDALIVLTDVENVIHVPLPNLDLRRSINLQTSLQSLIRDVQTIPLGERKGQRVPPEYDSQWESILSALWKSVAKPVLDSLAFVVPMGKRSRIFWCPTGTLAFLPIHAAGFYDPQYSQLGHKVYDFVVSSYVPTLSILTPSPEPDAPSGHLRFLAVRQPPSDGLSRLPGVDTELGYIREVIRNSSTGTVLQESSSETVEEVLELMREADWVHFACHGIQDAANPTESGLCLANERRLKLSNIIALSRPRGGLAFLSACQTATGDKKLSDEAVHIAAGMLFAGYGSVVGTMWSISDRLAPDVAMDIYKQLFSKGTRPDYREAARALQDAVGRLRDGGASFSEWLPFIHVGL